MSNKKTNRIFEDISNVDISESDIWAYDPEVLRQLLVDYSVSFKLCREKKDSSLRANIFWGTHDYEALGEGYGYHDEITPERIVGENGRVVMPRVLKDVELQAQRSKDKAEVFTPSWVCNTQNNLVDEKWFGRKDVFNREVAGEDGQHTWIPTEGKIEFPPDPKRSWKKYVVDNRMEITCGEAPYLVSRYDATTGEKIDVGQRIGLLDRKLWAINALSPDAAPDASPSQREALQRQWWSRVLCAYKSIYAFEWQGDNLLLAREALFVSAIEYYQAKWHTQKLPAQEQLLKIAEVVSWNVWQMDGLKYGIPGYTPEEELRVGLFDNELQPEKRLCRVMNWAEGDALTGDEWKFKALLNSPKL